MIHNDVLTQLQLLIKTSAPPLLEISQQQLELPQLMPGQKVPAHVVANLPNGRFQVLIADKSLDMNLPRNTQPGDTLELVFVAAKPRLTFILSSDLNNLAPATSPAGPKAQVSLSETARFLGGLLEKFVPTDSGQSKPATIAQAAPLLPGAPPKALEFAQTLRTALTQSGLFYESHQAQWVVGQRPLSDLLHEPQGKLSPAVVNLPLPENLPALGVREPVGQVPAQLATAPYVKEAAPQHVAMVVQNQSEALTPKVAENVQPAHPDTLPIIRQQLEALDARQLVWQGQVWPGQEMDWRIEERLPHEQGGRENARTEWQTSLHLVLPQLGEVNARLVLEPQGLRIQLEAADETTAALMRSQRQILQQGMETSGLQLAEIRVEHETAG